MAHDVYFVGTDIGTLGTKSVVVDLKGRILSNDYAEYGVLTPRPLWAEQWPDVCMAALEYPVTRTCNPYGPVSYGWTDAPPRKLPG
jgi:sugar (pentulose or hexulose) kinase